MPVAAPEQLVADWFGARLARITPANGYATDIGARVYLDTPPPEQNAPAPLAWYVDDALDWALPADDDGAQLGNLVLSPEVRITVLAGPGERAALRTAVRDVIRAIASRSAAPALLRGMAPVRPVAASLPERGQGNYLTASVTFAVTLSESATETQ